MRRFLPIILIAFAALFILPQLFKGGGSKTLSSKDRAIMTRDAMLRIDRAQKANFAKSGRYTDSLADFVVAGTQQQPPVGIQAALRAILSQAFD